MKFQISFILLVALIGCTNGQYYNSRQSISSFIGKQTQTINKLMSALHSDLTAMPSNLKDENLVRDVAYQLFNIRTTLTSFYHECLMMSLSVIDSMNPIYTLTTLIRQTQNLAFTMLSHAFTLTTRLATSGKRIEDAFPKTWMEVNGADVQYLLNDLRPDNLYYSMKSLLKNTINNLRSSSSYSLTNLLANSDLGKLLAEISGLIDKLSRYNF